MGMLVAHVKNAERMMTHAEVTTEGIELTFADGCKGVIATEFGEERVFEEGEGKLSGYVFWFTEPDVIKYWYKERLP